MADTEKIVYIVTHAGEDPERASLPFVLANAALAMEVEAVVALQGTAVFLAKGDCMKHVFAGGLPRLHDLVQSFLEAGGRLLVCVPCIRERKIEEADLIHGATPTAAAALTQEILTAKATLVY
jgi:predicted peroxiredoxin